MGAVSTARGRARPAVGGNGLLRRPVTAEKVLDRRARGEKAERIAQDLRLVVAEVTDLIRRQRAAGDARALTDKQAALIAQAARTPAPVAQAAPLPPEAIEVPPPPPPIPARRVPRVVARQIDPFGRAGFIARVRDMADRIPNNRFDGEASNPNAIAAAGLRHLADLYEHCPTQYPNYDVPGEGATLESTHRRFPRLFEVAGGTSGAGASLDRSRASAYLAG